jgi:hypothetical protein
MDVKVERTHEDWRHLSVQESRVPTPEREDVFTLNPMKDPPQCEVIMPRGDKNNNGKKARNISKKREKLKKLQEVPDNTSQKKGFQNSNFTGISI